jgi:ribosome biogenesis protein YTM1
VPATLKRYGLSQIINHLLALGACTCDRGNVPPLLSPAAGQSRAPRTLTRSPPTPTPKKTTTDPPRPFDFLINGELVRRSLEQHLLQHNRSLEQAVEIEYVPAVPPPAPRGAPPEPQDDWVSCAAALPSSTIGGAPLATGCYDGVVRLWRAGAGMQEEQEEGASSLLPSVEPAGAFIAHCGGVTAAAAAGLAAGSASASLLATAGKDHAARLWRLEASIGRGTKKTATATTITAVPLAELAGHSDTVEALAVAAGSNGRCATGGWDGQLLVWRCGRELERAAADEPAGASTPAAKKRRVRRGGEDEQEEQEELRRAPVVERPLARLVLAAAGESASAAAAGGHCVSALAWPTRSSLYSGAYDHSVRRWDVEAGVPVASCPTGRPVLSLAAPAPLLPAADEEADEGGEAAGGHLVAFGSADGALRVWDARAGPQVALAAGPDAASAAAAVDSSSSAALGAAAARVASSAAAAAGGGGAWVPSVAWRPGSLHHVATAAHDGAVRLFDLRSPVPLGTLAGLHGSGGEDKALCVAWWSGGGGGGGNGGGGGGGVPRFLASGGTDCRLRVSGLPAGCGEGIL